MGNYDVFNKERNVPTPKVAEAIIPTSELFSKSGPIFILGTFSGHTKGKIGGMIRAAGGSTTDDIEDHDIRYAIVSPAIWALESTKGANRVLRSIKEANESNENHLKALYKKWDKKLKPKKAGEESDENEVDDDGEEDDGDRDVDKYRIWICPLEWLEDSLQEGSMVDPDDYDYHRLEAYRRDAASRKAADERKKNGGKSKYKPGERSKLAAEARFAREQKEVEELLLREERAAAVAATLAAQQQAMAAQQKALFPQQQAARAANNARILAAMYPTKVAPVIPAPAVPVKRESMAEWRAARDAREAAAINRLSAAIGQYGRPVTNANAVASSKPSSSNTASIIISDSEDDDPVVILRSSSPQKKSSSYQPQKQQQEKKRIFNDAPIVLDSDSDDDDPPIQERIFEHQPLGKRVKTN